MIKILHQKMLNAIYMYWFHDDTLKGTTEGLFIRGETCRLEETSHLSEILFIPGLCEKNTPPE